MQTAAILLATLAVILQTMQTAHSQPVRDYQTAQQKPFCTESVCENPPNYPDELIRELLEDPAFRPLPGQFDNPGPTNTGGRR